MGKLTEPEILEKWSHIGMKIFPPQARLSTSREDRGWAIHVRWISETAPDKLSDRARGIDLHFPREMALGYLEADAGTQIKWDVVIQNAIAEKAYEFDPYQAGAGKPPVEEWVISPGRPAA